MSIQTAADRAAGAAEERDWDEAKEIVRAQYADVSEGSAEFWKLVMGVFKRMGGSGEERTMKKAVSSFFGWLRGRPHPETEHVVTRMLKKAGVSGAVAHPGARGGKFYYDARGRVQYGESPHGFTDHKEFEAHHRDWDADRHSSEAQRLTELGGQANAHLARAHEHAASSKLPLLKGEKSNHDAKVHEHLQAALYLRGHEFETEQQEKDAAAIVRGHAPAPHRHDPNRGAFAKCLSARHAIAENGELNLLLPE